jgi:hypothetical protein
MHSRVFVNRQDPGTCVRSKALVSVNRGDREIGVGGSSRFEPFGLRSEP